MVNKVLLHAVVEVLDLQELFYRRDALVGNGDLTLFFVHVVVVVAIELLHHIGEAIVQIGGAANLAADDQRGPGLVDQNRVNLVHDGEAVASLHHVSLRPRHVVAQIVKANFVVRGVGDVACVLFAFEARVAAAARNHQANGEAEPVVYLAHPFRVA